MPFFKSKVKNKLVIRIDDKAYMVFCEILPNKSWPKQTLF